MTYQHQDRKIEGRERACRSCSASIIWLRTIKGKKMPVNAETVTGNETMFEHGKHISHFATCPNANKHRKPR